MNNTVCALCNSQEMEPVIDLGFHPCADTFQRKEDLPEMEKRFPLQVGMCSKCGHAQLLFVVPATMRYQDVDYSYDSSNSPVSVDHFNSMATEVAEHIGLTSDDVVCDVGSNIGTLLAAFKSVSDCKVIGVDPSKNISCLANRLGVETVNDFFSKKSVRSLAKYGKPKVITATNVLNHSENVQEFFEVALELMCEDGLIVLEVPYHLELIQQTAFDTIYLEHVNYFSVLPFSRFLNSRGLCINKVVIDDYMCGTLRIYIKKGSKNHDFVNELIARELDSNLFSPATYLAFMLRVQAVKLKLNYSLNKIKQSGGKIIGIGAATKGNTLLNYCKIDSDLLEYITDSSKLKKGKLMPGSLIPIVGDEDIKSDITHALILPWNIADHLQKKLAYLNLKFITPIVESV